MTFDLLWYFFIYAFLGWCTEVVYAAVKTGKFINRGFLNGPYCPIYGFGVIIVLHLLEPVKNHVFYMFLGSVLITSTIEFFGGFLLEKIFHQRWWDYSDMPFNFGGYICPMFSFAWGLACLIVADRIHPLISSFVDWIPRVVGNVFLAACLCIFIIDMIATVKSILKLNKKLEIIDDISLKIREASEGIGENIATGAIVMAQKKEELEKSIEATKEILDTEITEMRTAQQIALDHRRQALDDLRRANRELLEATYYGQKRILKAFPGLKSINHKEALEKLKNLIG